MSTRRRKRFYEEARKRKVIQIFITYVGACFAVIEFLSLSSSPFNIGEHTIDLLYILAASGIPIVLIAPWLVKRKREIESETRGTENTGGATSDFLASSNLPASITTFIGREGEMEELRILISENRVLTITGSGGCGKTRLACETAAPLIGKYPDGVWFVDLSPVIVDELVPRQMAEALKITEQAGKDLTDTIIQMIKKKDMLIILDNCEHLLKASSILIGKLIRSVPGIKILATSREALKITGEKVWRIPSLTLVDQGEDVTPEIAMNSEAVKLFCNRAGLINPDFELSEGNVGDVIKMCNKLEGIPLAIEIVASRSAHMTIRDLNDKLSASFEMLPSNDPLQPNRQKTLHSTIEWGYNLLSEEEKMLFNRLAVFKGNLELESIEEVCGDDELEKDSILELLSRLIDKSLVNPILVDNQNTGYKLPETLKQFGLQNLKDQDQEYAIKKRHFDYFALLAEQANRERNTAQIPWFIKLDLAHDNFVAALEWSFENEKEDFVKLSAFLAWFWVWGSFFKNGLNYLNKALSLSKRDSGHRALILNGYGTLSLFTGAFENAFKFLSESTEIWNKLDHVEAEAITTCELSLAYCNTGNNKAALELARRSLELAEIANIQATINHCRICLGQVLVSLKQLDKATPLAEKMVEESKKYGQPAVLRLGYHFQADCHLMEGRFKKAEILYGLALREAKKSGNFFFMGIELIGLAMSVSAQHRYAKAIKINAAVTELSSKIGLMDPAELRLVFWIELVAMHLTAVKEKIGEDLTRKYSKAGKQFEMDVLIDYALDHDLD